MLPSIVYFAVSEGRVARVGVSQSAYFANQLPIPVSTKLLQELRAHLHV